MGKKHAIIVYQGKDGSIELNADVNKNTLWATQAQIAQIFDTTPQNITLHLKNIYKENELSQSSTCKDSLQVQKEGGRVVERKLKFYNLDAIISVGYRINSVSGTKFRQWATKTLRSHIVAGYTINKKRLAKNYDAFLKAVEEVKALLPSGGVVDAANAMELVKMFAGTWLSLDAYDKSSLPKTGATKRQVEFTAEELKAALLKLKHELMSKGEATDLFGSERGGESVAGIVGNVFQTFGGKCVAISRREGRASFVFHG
jgi:hypothetical protein